MKDGFVLPDGNACTAADFAFEAEKAGWDTLLSNILQGGAVRRSPATPDEIWEIRAYMDAHLRGSKPYDIVVEGETPLDYVQESISNNIDCQLRTSCSNE